ncbi:uncharacterized protein LOC134195215 [Corticium candelabrum]|uniref:uncharacterized protein LOC134195215 n=1 Tax=Corticium candelabrum TaxID=121492 RepID=UPI002E26D404|nr:uncharacterized protein LOC134195215 [Corticium candelabrum]
MSFLCWQALLVLFFDKVSSLIDLQELEGAKYGVEILNTPLAIRQVVENSVDVVSKYGQRYRCSWPAFEATRSKDKETSKNETEETSTSDVIKKLLTPMAGACLTTVSWTLVAESFGPFARGEGGPEGAYFEYSTMSASVALRATVGAPIEVSVVVLIDRIIVGVAHKKVQEHFMNEGERLTLSPHHTPVRTVLTTCE